MVATAEKNLWLVKTGDRILGPFSADEVIARIKTREIVVIDEVAAPLSRWRYVREEPVFKAAVDEIRKTMSNTREDTEIQGYTATATATEATDLDESRFPDSFNQPIGEGSFSGGDDQTRVQLTRREGLPAANKHSGESVYTDQPEVSAQYGVPTQSKTRSFQIGVWIGAVVLLGVVAYVLFSSPADKVPGEVAGTKEVSMTSPLVEADQAWKRGDFERALRFYSDAVQADPKLSEASSRLAPLLIQVSGQIVEAKRVLAESQTAGAKVNIHDREVALGLAALAEEELTEADSHFSAALANSPGSYTATFNLGVTAFMAKSYEKAERLFSTASSNAAAEPTALLMLARSVMTGEKIKPASVKLAENALDKLIKDSADYRQEAYLLKTYLGVADGGKKSVYPLIKMTLDTDPEMTAEHWHDPRLYLEPIRWKSLLSLCRKIQDDSRNQPARALYAFCLSKSGDSGEATKILNQALATSVEDPLLESVNAYVLTASEREDSARAALKLASKNTPPLLATFVHARICSRSGDVGCAEANWQLLSIQEHPSPAAFVGLSRLALSKGQVAKANDLDRKALEISPRYLPAIRLRDEVSKP